MKIINYSYLKEENQIIITCSGKIGHLHLIEEFQKMFQELQLESKVTILLDIKTVDFQASAETCKAYSDYFIGEKLDRWIEKLAVIADSPAQVVLSMMIMEDLKNRSTTLIKIFSTEEGAIQWLNRYKSYETINQIQKVLSNMKQDLTSQCHLTPTCI